MDANSLKKRYLEEGSPEWRAELDQLVGEKLAALLSDDEKCEFKNIRKDIELVDRIINEQYPDGSFEQSALYRMRLPNIGDIPDHLAIKRECAIAIWLEKHIPNYKEIVNLTIDQLNCACGYGRVYYFLDEGFRQAILSGDARRIRAMYLYQELGETTLALGNLLLTQDVLRLVLRYFRKALSFEPSEKEEWQQAAERCMNFFQKKMDYLRQALCVDQTCKPLSETLGARYLSSAILGRLSAQALIAYTAELIEWNHRALIERNMSLSAFLIFLEGKVQKNFALSRRAKNTLETHDANQRFLYTSIQLLDVAVLIIYEASDHQMGGNHG